MPRPGGSATSRELDLRHDLHRNPEACRTPICGRDGCVGLRGVGSPGGGRTEGQASCPDDSTMEAGSRSRRLKWSCSDAENLWTRISAHIGRADGMVRAGPGGTGRDRRRWHAGPARLPKPRAALRRRAAQRGREFGLSGGAVAAERKRLPGRNLCLRSAWCACHPYQYALSDSGSRQPAASVARSRSGDTMGISARRFPSDCRRPARGGSRRAALRAWTAAASGRRTSRCCASPQSADEERVGWSCPSRSLPGPHASRR
jgi:hypothetical protein